MASSPAPVLRQAVQLACIQLATGRDKAANLGRARERVLAAARGGAGIVALPECFNSPYGCDYFPAYAEPLQPVPPPADRAPSFHALSRMAADAGVFLIGGSIPEAAPVGPGAGAEAEQEQKDKEREGDGRRTRYYNTSLVFSPTGALLASHRKVHLFDVDIPGGITFRESAVLSAGNKITVVDLEGYGRVGLAVCYDVRFGEMAAVAARRGAFALVYPGAFNLTTGPLHWALLARARAVDNQVYVAMCSPARDPAADYRAWGHSLVVDPMGRVLDEAAESEHTVCVELRPEEIDATRRAVPVSLQRRFDVYPDVNEGRVRLEDPEAPGPPPPPPGDGK